ncbi:MAG: HEAT repeat domain-containing protein [Acidimicrobiales bacterium]
MSFLVSNLRAPVTRHRVLALRGLVRLGGMNAERWREVLSDPEVEMRRDALEQLAHAESVDQVVLEDVVGLLRDDDALVVDAAAFALGEQLYVPAVTGLIEVATSHDDARCRESAVASLGSIGDDAALPVIIAALNDKAPVRRRAIVALSNFEGPEVDAALDAAGEDRDWQVRAAVTQLRNE